MVAYFNLGLIISLFLATSNGHLIHNNQGDDDMHRRDLGTNNWEKLADVEDADVWFGKAQGKLEMKLKQVKLEKKAKNIIMFLGDGMSVSTVTASRIFKGQLEKLPFGEEGDLHMDTFPHIGTSKTYCSDWQVADSACSATAYLCGTKANTGTMGVKPSVLNSNCTTQMQKEHHVSSILAWAQEKGMSTGVVTTTTVTHASPGGAYAHIANRDWENDAKVKGSGWDSDTCDDIAEQLILQEPGVNINVILGGGREHLTPIDMKDVEADQFGKREDGKDLTKIWVERKAAENRQAQYVTGRHDLLTLDSNTDYILGLFAPNSVAYADKQAENDDPSLAEMTEAAIKILSKNPSGFFLFVEGGRIDHAHHDNNGKRAIAETLQFDDAIKLADDKTNEDDTLIVVTSDHAHLFSISGYPRRGNPILQFTGDNDEVYNRPFTTLLYGNGNGYRKAEWNGTECIRADISEEDVEGIDYLQSSQIPGSTHAGEDVLIFAKGPFAHLFSGVNEQSYIPHAMAYAACISPFKNNYCQDTTDNSVAYISLKTSIVILCTTCILSLRFSF